MSSEEKLSNFWKGFGIGFILAMFFSITTFTLGFYAYAEEYGPDEVVMIGGEYPREIPIYYVDKIAECGHHESQEDADAVRGCYMPNYPETILIEKDAIFAYTREGCTVRDHEILHAWGYQHHDATGYTVPVDGYEVLKRMPVCSNERAYAEFEEEQLQKRLQWAIDYRNHLEEKKLQDQQEMLQGAFDENNINHREPINPGPGHVYESLLLKLEQINGE